ncbi:PAS domain-containing protein [Archangium lansingense]|uniref:PAS domain-containing protein n=1 Tax=Archangium lansingense TaxID=2995310 RepID=UPI003B7CA136
MSEVRGPSADVGTMDGVPPEALLDVLSDGVTVFDADGRFTYLNTMAEGVLGFPREKLLGRAVGRSSPTSERLPSAQPPSGP